MEQFIRYLYEYEDGRPVRNVGFVKVEPESARTTVHIHGKGLRLMDETVLKLYLFYMENTETGDGEPICIYQGELGNVNPAINYRLIYTDEDTGEAENYRLICGIILMSENGRRYVACWDEEPVQIKGIQIWEKNAIPLSITEEIVQKVVQDYKEDVNNKEEETEAEEEIDRYIEPASPVIRKIQRQEIAMLPRCEWRVANNSFLLHGYYNYHYLILMEEDGQMWLGVPGIYHPREAKSAEVFGFTRFVRAEQEEAEEDFGYWCRKVKYMRKRE